ncbi:methylmalonyl-CoA epimerase [Arthrobacter sp. SW1]|uniref:VOC family protein n=1 Tax=Arthrobacter sp. SW1 TaxID=1920889 RepID=UPI000877BFA0|nr:VOC family protein [Arthrobacter sp. SW1]OFI37965.1 methylmalonyl-CoA epimerase [Arthrobacter sp. SW1]
MKLVQIAQRAVDLERATAFYSRLLGQEPAARFDPPGLVFFDLGGVRLLLERGAPSALLYLEQPALAETVARLEADGVRIISGPQLVFTHPDATLGPAGTEEWMAFIEDSEGNTVALVAHMQPAGD